MQSKESEKAFNSYIGSAVNYYKRKKGWTNKDLSIQTDLTESFVKQANTGFRHYNAYRIWKIASVLGISISDLYPPTTNNTEGLERYQELYPNASREDFEKFINLIGD